MTNEKRITTDDLTDEQIEQILNSRLFQKGLAYRRLADGIEILADEDEIFDSMINSILKQHSTVGTEDSVREFFRLFRQEVETFTEPLVQEETDVDASDVEQIYVEENQGDE